MTLQRVLMVSTAVLMLASAAASQGNRSPEARLRAAMDKETVDGDLKAAIDGYKQVISQSGASRTVVAQALLRLGMAYEKQGDAEARKSYERLVREFGDQPAIVQQATARMAAAGTVVASGPTLRQVCSGSDCAVGFISQGRWLLSTDDNRLTINDLSTGNTRVVAERPAGGQICCAEMSPDGGRIAYTIRGAERNSEIVVANADGGNSRTVYRGATSESWSSDGRRILATAGGQTQRLLWVTVADGASQPIPTSDWENMDIFRVSPDGRYVAFSGNRDTSNSENVYLIAADGSGETLVAPSPTYQEPVGWSPDGRYLFYTQVGLTAAPVVRAPTLWAAPIVNGRVQGTPVRVRQFDQQSIILGLSPTGTLYYREISSTGDPYTASMDPASGKVTSPPAVLPTPSPAAPATWSPDSRRIAYLTSALTGAALQRDLHVFSIEGGKDRRVPTSVSFNNSLCWPPGADAILTNRDTGQQQNRYETLRVDLSTGETRAVFPGAPSFRLWNCTDTTAANNDPMVVKVRNLSTGTETELYRLKNPRANYGMSKISPDGRQVAFLESLDPDTSVLLTVPSTGGQARELARAKAPAKLQEADGHAWSHDSRFVYFLKRANGKAPYELYRVPATGGAEERMGLQGQELRGPEIAPNGRMVFFVMGGLNRPEIWAMENFLPVGK